MSLTDKQSRFVESSDDLPSDGFYVYGLVDPADDACFYVGKGSRRRAFQHAAEARAGRVQNAHKHVRIREIQKTGADPRVVLFGEHESEDEALRLERRLIGSMKGLTNIAPGHIPDRERAAVQAREWLSRVKPFCDWVVERHRSATDRAMYWLVVGGLSKIASGAGD